MYPVMAIAKQGQLTRNNARLYRKKDKMAEAVAEPKTANEIALENLTKAAEETNKTRSGVGTRVATGMTRGKGTQPIKWERFDESQPDTLPKTMKEFMEVTGVKDESKIVSFLVSGYNDEQYTQASDPIAEHVNPVWPEAVQDQFRLVVRNYFKAMQAGKPDFTLEEAVNLIKPGIEAQFGKR